MQLSLLAILIASFVMSGVFLYFLPAKHESVRLTIAAVLTPAIVVLIYLLLKFDEFGLLTLVALFSSCAAVIGSTSSAAVVAIVKRKK